MDDLFSGDDDLVMLSEIFVAMRFPCEVAKLGGSCVLLDIGSYR